MSREGQFCLGIIIFGLLAVGMLIIMANQHIEEIRTCIAGGYANMVSFNGVRVCVGIRDGAYSIEGLESVRLRLGLERGK